MALHPNIISPMPYPLDSGGLVQTIRCQRRTNGVCGGWRWGGGGEWAGGGGGGGGGWDVAVIFKAYLL